MRLPEARRQRRAAAVKPCDQRDQPLEPARRGLGYGYHRLLGQALRYHGVDRRALPRHVVIFGLKLAERTRKRRGYNKRGEYAVGRQQVINFSGRTCRHKSCMRSMNASTKFSQSGTSESARSTSTCTAVGAVGRVAGSSRSI